MNIENKIVQILISFLIVWSSSAPADNKLLPPRFKDVVVNIEKLELGQHLAVLWGRYTVWILRRTNDDIKNLINLDRTLLAAPNGENLQEQFTKAFDNHPKLPNLLELDQLALEKNIFRSYREDILVIINMSPYSGCLLIHEPIERKKPKIGWIGGFIDPCAKVTFDIAGHIFQNKSLKKYYNLYIPPHQFIDKNTILIGVGNRNISNTNYEPVIDYDSLSPTRRLIEAAKRGKIKIVKQLLDFGIPIESSIGPNITALLVASLKGNNEIIKLLLDRGADVNKSNKYGFSPLHAAISGYRIETVKILISRGANVNSLSRIPDSNGTPLNFIISWMHDEENAEKFVSILLKHGANTSIMYQGKNAIDWAKDRRYDRVLKILKQQ